MSRISSSPDGCILDESRWCTWRELVRLSSVVDTMRDSDSRFHIEETKIVDAKFIGMDDTG